MPPKASSGSTRRSLSAAIDPKEAAPRQRQNLTLHDKIRILDFVRANPEKPQTQVAVHFQKNGFPNLKQPVISRLAKEEQKLREMAKDPANLSFKRPRLVEHPEVEDALATWILQAQAKGIKITGDVLREKANRFAAIYGIDGEEFLSLSNGWLDKFKQRHALKQYRFHGEAGSVNVSNVAEERKRLQALTAEYGKENTFNMDETGLNDRMSPDRGLATEQLSGQKADKHRITLALTVNASGTDRLPPLFIGHARKPRCFKKKEGSELGFDYHWNKKAWMTGAIFQEFLNNLDKEMKKQNRKILLLVDNAPSHIYNQGEISNVRVEFLAPNMTSHIQPLDAGIIRCLKAHYKALFCRRAVDREELGEANLYKIDQLEAMHLVLKAWGMVTPRTVANCWKHVGIFTEDARNEPVTALASDTGLREAVDSLEGAIKTLAETSIAPSRVMGVEEMLNAAEEKLTESELNDVEIVEQVKAARAEEQEEAEDGEVEEIAPPTISIDKGIEAVRELAQLCATLQLEGPEFRDAHMSLSGLSRSLRRVKSQNVTQKTLTDYFKK